MKISKSQNGRSDKIAKLKAMKRVCVFLLILFLSLRLLLEFTHFFKEGFLLSLLKGITEAAIVGGMADWFAVVALFRHPLGLPIPHTAIIPMKKDSIGDNLGKFINSEFFKEDAIKDKISNLNLIDRFFNWIMAQEEKRVLSDFAAKALNGIIKDVDSATVDAYLKNTASNIVRRIDLPAFMSRMLAFSRDSGLLDIMLDKLITEVLSYIRKNEDEWSRRIKEKRWKFSPLKMLDHSYYEAFKNATITTLTDASNDRNHQLRLVIRREIGTLIYRLHKDNELRDRIDALKNEIIEDPSVSGELNKLWTTVKAAISSDTQSEHSIIKNQLHDAIFGMIEKYRTNDSVKEWMNSKQTWLSNLLLANKNQLAGFISGTVKKWDSKTISEKLELEVGTDLQFIRINGTIVGGVIGGILVTILHLLR